MKPDMIRYGVIGVALLMVIQWMTGKFDDGQIQMLDNQNLIITTLQRSTYVQEAILKEMETGNNLSRRRLGLKVKE